MPDPHKNFSYSTIATAPSPASSGTSLVVQAGDGAKFPAVSFNATVWPASTQPTTANAEIVRVTNISTDTFTITRAQENSSARTIVVGDQIAATVTAKTLTDVEHDQYANTYLTIADETIAAGTQVIYEDYLELAASFVYELSVDAILVIGDFSAPLPALDEYPNILVTVADEQIPANSEIMFSDYYELSPPFAVEVGLGALLQLGTYAAELTPWFVDITPITRPSATTGSWAYVNDSLDVMAGAFSNNASPAVNDSITYQVALGAGTWTLQVLLVQSASSGTATITLGSVGFIKSIDNFNGSTTRNVVNTTTGIVVPYDGVYPLKFLIASKNGTSTNFAWFMLGASLQRTA